MTFREAFLQTKSWRRKIVIISLYHNQQLATNNAWRVRDTAEYFDVSIGLVSEDLKLTEMFEQIRECKTRKEAVALLRWAPREKVRASAKHIRNKHNAE